MSLAVGSLHCRSLAAVTAAAARRIGSAGRRQGRGFEPLPLENPASSADRSRRQTTRNGAQRGGVQTAQLNDDDDDDDFDDDGDGEMDDGDLDRGEMDHGDADEEGGTGSALIRVTFEWGSFTATRTVALQATESVAQAKMQLREHGRRLAMTRGVATPTLTELDLHAHLPSTASQPAATVSVTRVEDLYQAEAVSCCQTSGRKSRALPHRGSGRFGATNGNSRGERQNQSQRPSR